MREKRESRAKGRRRVKPKVTAPALWKSDRPTTGHDRSLTSVAQKPSLVIEQATSSYSFRFPELSQPI